MAPARRATARTNSLIIADRRAAPLAESDPQELATARARKRAAPGARGSERQQLEAPICCLTLCGILIVLRIYQPSFVEKAMALLQRSSVAKAIADLKTSKPADVNVNRV